MLKEGDDSIMIESSFLKNAVEEDTFQSLCKKCELEWKTNKCEGGNPIKRICIDEECKNTIFDCNLQSCKICTQSHKICKSVHLAAFSQLLTQMTDYQKSFFKKLYLIDQQLIQQIKKSQLQLVKKISTGSLEQEFIKILEIITTQKKTENFHGKEADKLYAKLRLKVKEKNQNENQLEKLFKQRSIQMLDGNINLKNNVFQHFLKASRPNLPEISKPSYFITSPLITVCINELYMSTAAFYQKKIYNNYGFLQYPDQEKMTFEKKHMDFLKTSLGNPTSSTLLFRASEHSFQVAEFHARCDGRTNTLTIIRTQFRKTIFAFAAQAWNSTSNNYISDSSGKSCIVWLDPQQKIPMTNASQSIYCYSTYGPTFGAHDIYIANGSAAGTSGTTSFPTSYNSGRGGQSQTNYTLMTGAPGGTGFKVMQYEVYQLAF